MHFHCIEFVLQIKKTDTHPDFITFFIALLNLHDEK